MDSFSIRLSDGYTEVFSKTRFLKLFPKGLLTTALEGDPETKNIDLTHPCVTPVHLHYLAVITRYGTYTPPPAGMATKEVGRYLDLPWMEFHDHPCVDFNLTDPMTQLTPARALDCALEPYDPVVAKWAIRQLGKDVNTRTKALTTIFFRGYDDLFEELLRAGLDLKTASWSVIDSVLDIIFIKLEEYVLVEILLRAHAKISVRTSGNHLAILNTILERQLLPEETAIKILHVCTGSLSPTAELKLVQLISPERYGDIYMFVGGSEATRWLINRRPDVYDSYTQLYIAVIENWVDYFDDLTKFDEIKLISAANQAAMEGRWLVYERLRSYHQDEHKKIAYSDIIVSNPNNLIRAIGPDPCITKVDLRCALSRAFFASRGEVSSHDKPLDGDLLVEIWGETTCAEALREV